MVYDVNMASLEHIYKWAAAGQIEDTLPNPATSDDQVADDDDIDASNVTDDAWTADVDSWWYDYCFARLHGDVDAMWTIHFNCAERLLGASEVGGIAAPRKLIQREAIGRGATEVGSLRVRQLTEKTLWCKIWRTLRTLMLDELSATNAQTWWAMMSCSTDLILDVKMTRLSLAA